MPASLCDQSSAVCFCPDQAHETKDPSELHALITDILRVFVDARHHIPRHRSQRLYHHLMEKVGVERHLWVVGVLMMESGVRGRDVPSLEGMQGEVATEEVCQSVCCLM